MFHNVALLLNLLFMDTKFSAVYFLLGFDRILEQISS